MEQEISPATSSPGPLRKWILRIFIAGGAFAGLILLGIAIWLLQLSSEVEARLESNSFVPPTRYFSAPYSVKPGQKIKASALAARLSELGYRRREANQRLLEGDYNLLSSDECRKVFPDGFPTELSHCLMFNSEGKLVPDLQMVAFHSDGRVLQSYEGHPLKASAEALLPPQLFAQFLENQPIFQQPIDLGEVPTYCLNAVLAIEDDRFLDHAGISPTGILRAFIVNLQEGRAAQGGSTITQQLVKNLFLTHDKTLKRKLTEVGMSLILEAKASKDQILQNYLNIIYLGQAGPYQIRGYKAATRHYLDKPVSDLSLSDCALLAAVINNPGRYNPFRHPERAMARRSLVLKRMEELNLITADERVQAEAAALPARQPQYTAIGTAAYFVDAVNKELAGAGVEVIPGMSIYTSMDSEAQAAAEESLEYLKRLDERVQKSKKTTETLQGVLIGATPRDGKIRVLAGGRNFRTSPYNRAIESKRQVGSIMKPFVFLAALESYEESGAFYTPLSIINDSPFTFRYEGQSWRPENYGGTYYGKVPLFFALKNSLNAATAKLGTDIGIEPIVDMARRLGVTSELKSLPSLTLGAFELSPLEVTRAFTAIARFGHLTELSTLFRVESYEGELLYEPAQRAQRVVDAGTTATLIGMLKNTLISGTAASASSWGLRHPAAGKTGTTSDNRDAWFAGFTPNWVGVSWVGYDSNASHGLTGASGALPLWAQFMAKVNAPLSTKDFDWPTDVEEIQVSLEDLGVENPKLEEKQAEFPAPLILKQGSGL